MKVNCPPAVDCSVNPNWISLLAPSLRFVLFLLSLSRQFEDSLQALIKWSIAKKIIFVYVIDKSILKWYDWCVLSRQHLAYPCKLRSLLPGSVPLPLNYCIAIYDQISSLYFFCPCFLNGTVSSVMFRRL